MIPISERLLTITTSLSLPYGLLSGGMGIQAGFQEGFTSENSTRGLTTSLGFLVLSAVGGWLRSRQHMSEQQPDLTVTDSAN